MVTNGALLKESHEACAVLSAAAERKKQPSACARDGIFPQLS